MIKPFVVLVAICGFSTVLGQPQFAKKSGCPTPVEHTKAA